MEPGLYVALSGQLALQRRLDTIANNVANSSTAGFRAENVTFDSVISRGDKAAVTYASQGASTFARASGGTTQTGNPLDIAISGDAYLAVATPSGIAYTRDGRMQISPDGDLATASGQPLLDISGAPVQIDPRRGPVEISRDGTIRQNGQTAGRLGLFTLPPDALLSRHDGAGLVADRPAEPVSDFNEFGVVQGYVESSNVNAVMEMTRLISVTRAFEALSSAIEQSDRRLSDAIRTLGSGQG